MIERSPFDIFFSYERFLFVIGELSTYELVQQLMLLPAFAFINVMRLMRWPINMINNSLRDSSASRLNKIILNVILMGFVAIFTCVVSFLFVPTGTFVTILVPIFLLGLSFFKMGLHLKALQALKEIPVLTEEQKKIRAYHRKQVVESLLALAASIVMLVIPAKAAPFIFAYAVVSSAVSIVRHAPYALKVLYKVVASIVDPEGHPWEDLDSNTVFNDPLEDFDNDEHNASNSKELQLTAKESVNKLALRYPNINQEQNLEEIKAYLNEQKESTDEMTAFRAKNALKSFYYIVNDGFGSSFDFKKTLTLIWEGAKDQNALPLELKGKEVDLPKYIALRKSALLEQLYDSQTTYVGSQHTHSCLAGTYTRIVRSLHHAHPDVVMLESTALIKAHALDGTSLFLKNELLKKSSVQQAQILKSWDDENPNSEASVFRQSLVSIYDNELQRIYESLLAEKDRKDITNALAASAKPIVHPLVDLEIQISAIIAPLSPENLRKTIVGVKQEADALYNTIAEAATEEESKDRWNSQYNRFKSTVDELLVINKQALETLKTEISDPFQEIIACSNRLEAVESLRAEVTQACEENTLAAVKAYNLSQRSYEALKELDTYAKCIQLRVDSFEENDKKLNSEHWSNMRVLQEKINQAYVPADNEDKTTLADRAVRLKHSITTKFKQLQDKINTLTPGDANASNVVFAIPTRQAAIQILKNLLSRVPDNVNIIDKYIAYDNLYNEFMVLDGLSNTLYCSLQSYTSKNPQRQEAITTIKQDITDAYEKYASNPQDFAMIMKTLTGHLQTVGSLIRIDHSLKSKTRFFGYMQPASKLGKIIENSLQSHFTLANS